MIINKKLGTGHQNRWTNREDGPKLQVFAKKLFGHKINWLYIQFSYTRIDTKKKYITFINNLNKYLGKFIKKERNGTKKEE